MGEKKNKRLVVIIIILMVIIIGSVSFINIDVINSNNGNNKESKSTIAVTEEKAKELYTKIVRPLMIAGVEEGDATSFSLQDISTVVATYVEESDYLQNLCGTDLEKELISEGIIAEKNGGQFDCENHSLMTVKKFNEIAKKALGPDLNVSVASGEGIEYYEKQQLIRVYIQGEALIEYDGYEVNSDILIIRALFVSGGSVEVEFKLDENNYYLHRVRYIKIEYNDENLESFALGISYSKSQIDDLMQKYNKDENINEATVKFVEVDIDEDGKQDLIVTNGDKVDEASAIGRFFKNSDSGYIYVGSTGVGHATFSKEKGKSYINKLSAHMGYWSTYKYSIENNELKIEMIDSGEVEKAEEYPTLHGEDLKVRE